MTTIRPPAPSMISSSGNAFADGSFTGGGADFAEMIEVSTGAHSVEAGDLLVIDPTRPRSVLRSATARSTLVFGVYSTEPGFVGSEREFDEPDPFCSGSALALTHQDMADRFDEVPVAVLGIVPVKASAENGPIHPGDLLVSASTPGHVMRDERPRAGSIVGKAMGSLAEGRGILTILVTLQ